MSTSTAQQHYSVIRSGGLAPQIFCAIAVLVGAWYLFFQDWTPMRGLRLQSPITFISDRQPPAVTAAGIGATGSPADTVRVATSAAFDLGAVARAEGIELTDEDTRGDADRQAYIRRYAATAIAEQKKYGIPASITIAQGLIETRAGTSGLATKNNNHFGMKCFSKTCKRGHCSNFTDDTHKDFFKKYPSAWASFRDHSKLLTGGRYQRLAALGTDYRAWAHGLKKAGYATAPNYAESLIRLIRLYGLDRLDKM